MNGTTPSTPTFLGREPTLWIVAFEAALFVAVLFGLPVTETQVMGINAFVVALLSLLVRQNVTPNANVLEFKHKNVVVAGPANDRMATGAKVRSVA